MKGGPRAVVAATGVFLFEPMGGRLSSFRVGMSVERINE